MRKNLKRRCKDKDQERHVLTIPNATYQRYLPVKEATGRSVRWMVEQASKEFLVREEQKLRKDCHAETG